MTDLRNYSTPELKTLSNRCSNKSVAAKRNHGPALGLRSWALAKGAGIELKDLLKGLKPSKAPVPARYQNPENPSEQAVGRALFTRGHMLTIKNVFSTIICCAFSCGTHLTRPVRAQTEPKSLAPGQHSRGHRYQSI